MANEAPFPRLHRPLLWHTVWYAALAATVVVCLLPLPPMPLPVDHLDKWQHTLGYALLAAYAVMLFARWRERVRALLGLVLLGVMIELLQSLLPWRSAEWLDLLANGSGVLLGAAVAFTPAVRLLHVVDARLWRR